MPASGDVEDLLSAMSTARDRTMQLLVAPLGSAISGLLVSTGLTDYVVVAEGSSPERQCAIICHEVAHALLGHSHHENPGSALIESGLLQRVDPGLARDVVAARHAYAHTKEIDAETVATYISIKLRRRVMRGGHTYYDDLWN
ncbi:MAG TPA: hypothetical protein VK053_16655 [Jiangellaceae bacterium]|nr:hypothetical protein [Jiangellaceae bacterium]